MRTLILSCNTGAGHNSCARAIQESYRRHGEVCDITDSLLFISRRASEFISNWHTRIYLYAPKVFSVGYDKAEGKSDLFREGTPLYKYITAGAERIGDFIEEGGYENIICTHVFPALAVTELRRRRPDLKILTSLVTTDYTCTPSTADSRLDRYFLPSALLAEEFIRDGVPEEKLSASGMPVRSEFYSRIDKAKAKEALGLRPEQTHLLMMCGSMGCGPMEDITRILRDKLGENDVLTVGCGKNEALCEKLRAETADVPNIRVCGTIDNMPLWMHGTDLFLTRPGGLSTSEAVAAALPMVLIDAVAGCEEHNLDFFLRAGMAVTADTPEAIADTALTLAHDEERLAAMRGAMREASSIPAAERIYADLASSLRGESVSPEVPVETDDAVLGKGGRERNILLLSCETGEGHTRAAEAIAAELSRRGIRNELFDPLLYAGRRAEQAASESYTAMTEKSPELFNRLYRAGDIYDSTGLPSILYRATSRYAESLRSFIELNGFTAVVCTHLFPMEAMTALRKEGGFTVPCWGVLTDYAYLPLLRETELDGYFLPHEDLRLPFTEKGLPNARLYTSGIPIDARFCASGEKDEARKALGIPADGDVFLVMCSGIAPGHAGLLCSEILRQCEGKCTILALTGRYGERKEVLDEQFADTPQVHVVPFAEDVSLYMRAADVMLTKPGGLVSTEAAAVGLPLVHLLVSTADEDNNAAFFASYGLSVCAENAVDAAAKAIDLARSPEKAARMRTAQKAAIPTGGAASIVDRITLD